jgi:cytochrome c-type biogenesis protein CcmF
LGTVFPLLYEALNHGTQVGVGAPYFNRFFVPVGLALLFLMAVAPALPWRKTTVEVMRGRLAVPAVFGVLVVVICVVAGVRGVEPLLAFGLGAFAAASAGRALVLSVRGAYRGARTAGASPHRAALTGWRGFVGRANGGMVVHIGVVVVAIGLAAATSYLHRGQLHLARGHTATFSGHTVEFVGTRVVTTPSHSSYEAVLRVDGRGFFYPAVSQFGAGTATVGTPAIDSSWTNDLYLTIATNPSGAVWSFGVVEQPLVMWLWVGAGIIGFGSLLSAIPGKRRRPTDPVSAPVVEAAPPVPTGGTPPVAGPEDRPEVADPLPVGAGDPS